MSCHLCVCVCVCVCVFSRVGWANIAQLLKAAVGCPQPEGLHICLVTFYFVLYSRVGWANTAQLLKAAQGPPRI